MATTPNRTWPDREQVGWLRTLIAAHREVQDAVPWDDPDPTATAEMLRECGRLADQLEAGMNPTSDSPEAPTTADDEDIPL